MSLRSLNETLGAFLAEGRAKKVRKRKRKKRAEESDKVMARQLGAAMKSRVAAIEKLIPSPWKLSAPLVLDKQTIEKFGQAMLEGELKAEFDYPIGETDDGDRVYDATARIAMSCYPVKGEDGIMCDVLIDEFDPPMSDVNIEIEWKRKKKPFDASKDMMLLLKDVMKGATRQMQEYEEFE